MPMEWDPLFNFKWPSNGNPEDFQANFSSSPQTFHRDPTWADLRWQDPNRNSQPDPCLPPVSFQQIGSIPQTGISPPSLGQSSATSSRNLFPDSESYEHDSEEGQDGSDQEENLSPQYSKEKRKLTRGSRACTVCRRLKLRCVGAQDGRPCRKCAISNQECIFPESKRGKSSKKTQEELASSVRKMEQTLAAVINSINDPALSALVSGMASCPPSPKLGSEQSSSAFPPPKPVSPASQVAGGHDSSHPPYLPMDTLNPLGLLAEISLAHGMDSKPDYDPPPQSPEKLREMHARIISPGIEGHKVGVANTQYFKPGPMTLLPVRRLFIEHQVQPEMLSFVTTEEVVAMFQIYFEHVNPLACLLVPDLQTPSYVCARSPFLLTTICAIASRFSESLRKHHKSLTKLARKLAFDVPSKGYKSLEIVQAYLLLTLWGYGAACKYEHDTTWLLLGLAIRMATDLNLHRPSPASPCTTPGGVQQAIEIRNRERTWIMCFILDRSISAQLGKPHTIQENYLLRNVSQWWQHPVAAPLDAGLAVYAELQRIVTRCLEMLYSDTATTTGLQMECNYLVTVRTTENHLLALREEWAVYIDNYCASSPDDSQVAYWKTITEFYNTYAVLLLNSLGLQDAVERSPINLPHFFSRCLKAASDCAKCIRDELGPRGYLRYSPLSHFIEVSYAVLTLLKLSRPEFQTLMNCQEECLDLANAVIKQLEKAKIDSEHNPGLFATFLQRAVANRLSEDDNPALLAPDGSHDNYFQLNGRMTQDDLTSPYDVSSEPSAILG